MEISQMTLANFPTYPTSEGHMNNYYVVYSEYENLCKQFFDCKF